VPQSALLQTVASVTKLDISDTTGYDVSIDMVQILYRSLQLRFDM
jgi:hypothetical protein